MSKLAALGWSAHEFDQKVAVIVEYIKFNRKLCNEAGRPRFKCRNEAKPSLGQRDLNMSDLPMWSIQSNECSWFSVFDSIVLFAEGTDRSIFGSYIKYGASEPKQPQRWEEQLRPRYSEESDQRNECDQHQAKCDELECQ